MLNQCTQFVDIACPPHKAQRDPIHLPVEREFYILAIFVGYYVVWSVTPALHTPLMSVTNAISSVVIVGALIAVGADFVSAAGGTSKLFGLLAVALASVNIFGGFLVTQRMLAMYKKKGA